MQFWGKDEHPVRLIFLAVVLSLVYLAILLPAGFLEAARLRSYDTYCRWRSAVSHPPQEVSDLLLVTIDEESQRQLDKKWPWDRTVFAEFLGKLAQAGPSAVVLDFVLSGASDPAHDEALAQAIRSGPPVLLASYLDRHGDPVLPHTLFTDAGGIAGLINHPRDIDLTVRKLFAGIRLPMRPQPLFATEINAAAVHRRIPLSEIQLEPRGRLKIGTQTVPLEPPVGCMAINSLLSPEQISTVSFWQVMAGQVSPERIRGKIVMVGSTREITHDVYPSPLGLMPGVMISANGILTILSNQFVRPLPMFLTILMGFFFVLAILLATYWLPLLQGVLATSLLMLGGVGAGFLCVLLFNFRAESLSILILGMTSWLTAGLYRYLLLISESVRLHRHVVTDPISGAVTERYFRLRLEAAWLKWKQSRKPLSMVIVQMEPISAQLHQITWTEVQKKLRASVETFQRHLKTRGGVVGRFKNERIGIFLPGLGLEEARGWAEGARRDLPPEQGHLAFGIASTERSSLPSPEHLLKAAEAASRRSWTERDRVVEIYDLARDGAEQLESKKGESSSPGDHSLDYVTSEMEDRNQSLEKALVDLQVAYREMENHFLEVTKSLVVAMDTKDAYTAGHLDRVSRYATRLAEALQFPKEEIEAIREAALLHDIGKLNLPEEILHKTGSLTPEEVEVIKKHLELGAKILDPMKFFRPITTILYHHHERYDGKGYPHGLTGEFIPSGAQIITIADSFDAMTTNRGYNKPKNAQEAIEELHRGAGTQFNPAYVDVFIKLIQTEGPHLASYTSHSL